MKEKMNWYSLLIGILFVITGILSWINPTGTLIGLVILFGFMAILSGVESLTNYFQIKKLSGVRPIFSIIGGILSIITGIIIFAYPGSGVIAIGTLFSLWFILDSIGSLAALSYNKNLNTLIYWLSVAIFVFSLLVGISLLFQPIVAAMTMPFIVGIYFLSAGIGYILRAF